MAARISSKLITGIVFITLLFPVSLINAAFKDECRRNADRNSRDYRNFGVGSGRYSSGFSGITGSRNGTSLSGVSGRYGTRNRTAYNATYQHCMSSYGG